MRFQTLPHKNLIISAVFALSIFLLAFFLADQPGLNYEGKTALVVRAIPTTTSGPMDIDTDNDGLPDWKERLLSSDINIPDSDGDGTTDGNEVRAGRNPALANTANGGLPPNDKLAYLQDPNFATSSTDALGLKKEFFAKYLAEESRDIKETTFMGLIKKIDTKKFAPKYELTDLNISSDNSGEGIKNYVNAFGVLIKKYSSHPLPRDENTLITDTITKKGTNTRQDLQLLAINYKNFSNDLLLLPVPSILAKAHLSIVNGYGGMGIGIFSIEKIHENPLDGTAGYEAYVKYRLDVTTGYALIVSLLGKEQITLAPTEPGYPFYRVIALKKSRTAS